MDEYSHQTIRAIFLINHINDNHRGENRDCILLYDKEKEGRQTL